MALCYIVDQLLLGLLASVCNVHLWHCFPVSHLVSLKLANYDNWKAIMILQLGQISLKCIGSSWYLIHINAGTVFHLLWYGV